MARATAKTADKKKAKPRTARTKAAASASQAKAKPQAKSQAKPRSQAKSQPQTKSRSQAKSQSRSNAGATTAKTARPAGKTAAKTTSKPAPKPRSKPKPRARARKLPFAVDDYVVYPTHGVGRVTGVERREISGMDLELYVVDFDMDKMVLRVPVEKAQGSGMRKLSTPQKMTTALSTLKGRARIKRTMWSRRAQEYEAKINSGDPVAIAEVIRDLHRSANQPEQSYSERQIYESALERLARELAAVERIDEAAATERLEDMLRAA